MNNYEATARGQLVLFFGFCKDLANKIKISEL